MKSFSNYLNFSVGRFGFGVVRLSNHRDYDSRLEVGEKSWHRVTKLRQLAQKNVKIFLEGKKIKNNF